MSAESDAWDAVEAFATRTGNGDGVTNIASAHHLVLGACIALDPEFVLTAISRLNEVTQ